MQFFLATNAHSDALFNAVGASPLRIGVVRLGALIKLPRSQLFNPIKRTTPSTHWREWHLEIWLGSSAASYSIVRTTPSTHWREFFLEGFASPEWSGPGSAYYQKGCIAMQPLFEAFGGGIAAVLVRLGAVSKRPWCILGRYSTST